MATQFTTNNITKLSEWNAVLASGCCCSMPSCPVPTKECEAKTASKQAFQLAVTEEEDEALAYTYGVYAPFIEPTGDPEDDVPTLYRRVVQQETVTGTAGSYESFEVSPYGSGVDWDSAYILKTCNAANDTYSYTDGWWDDDPPTEGTSTSNYSKDIGSFSPVWGVDAGDIPWEDVTPLPDCTETTRTDEKQTAVSGTPIEPGSGPWGNNPKTYWINAERVLETKLEAGRTKSQLVAAATADLPTEWSAGVCNASLVVSWPKIEDVRTGSPAAWPDCATGPPTAAAYAEVVKTRFRWVIPNTFTGSYFKITWDILEEPDGWNSGLPGAPSRTLTPATPWEWTGPGVEGNENSWKSGWYEIEPPSVPGTRRIVNMKIECYTEPFGSRPDPVGEQVTL